MPEPTDDPTDTTYYDNGRVKHRGATVDGEMDGPWEWYRRDGSLMRTGWFGRGRDRPLADVPRGPGRQGDDLREPDRSRSTRRTIGPMSVVAGWDGGRRPDFHRATVGVENGRHAWPSDQDR